MITGINLPLEAALLLCAGCSVAGIWIGQSRANRRLDPRRSRVPNPLADLLKRETLAQAIDLAAHRDKRRAGSHAVLHGRIDQIAALRAVWNPDTRAEVREHVAAVMRTGLRRDDGIALAEGEGFTILIPGADEHAAVRIADRLRRVLAQLHLPQLGSGARLTASFGVAADRFGESEAGLDQRARWALDAAVARGDDQVVPASEIEEVTLLPAPAAPAAPAASTAAASAA